MRQIVAENNKLARTIMWSSGTKQDDFNLEIRHAKGENSKSYKAKGSWHKLTADKGDKFKALVFPDSQCTDYSYWQKLSKDAYAHNKNVDFYINMGDLVDNGEHQLKILCRYYSDREKSFCVEYNNKTD